MPKWTVHVEELRKFGFSEPLIQEAKRSEEKGLFSLEPGGDAVEKIMAKCRELGCFEKQDAGLLRRFFARIVGRRGSL